MTATPASPKAKKPAPTRAAKKAAPTPPPAEEKLAREILTHSLLLALIGGALGLVVAVGGIRVLAWLGADELPRGAEIGGGAVPPGEERLVVDEAAA